MTQYDIREACASAFLNDNEVLLTIKHDHSHRQGRIQALYEGTGVYLVGNHFVSWDHIAKAEEVAGEQGLPFG